MSAQPTNQHCVSPVSSARISARPSPTAHQGWGPIPVPVTPMTAYGAALFFQTPQGLSTEEFEWIEGQVLARLQQLSPGVDAQLFKVGGENLPTGDQTHDAGLSPQQPTPGTTGAHELDVDLASDTVYLDGQQVSFSGVEYRLLRYLVQHCSRYVPRNELAGFLESLDAIAAQRSIDVYVSRIRRKLGPVRHVVETVRGGGYRFLAGRHSRVRGPAEYNI